MRRFRDLLEIEDDYVREILQQAIRDTVTEAIKDNLIGAGEILTGMLPKVLAGLMADLESKDWMIRSRAQAAVLKYAMEFKDKEGKDGDLGVIRVVHNVALPDTPLGTATAGEVEAIEAGQEAEAIEAFEADWPKCSRCQERKHPDTMHLSEHGNYCSSCRLTQAYTSGRVHPAGMLERDPEFGG
jgi:hypothetical protein